MRRHHFARAGRGVPSGRRSRAAGAVALLAASLGLAACGGEESSRTPAPAPQTAPEASRPVTPERTAGRVGDAVVADRRGLERLGSERRMELERLRELERRAGVGAAASCAGRDLGPAEGNVGEVNAALLCLINGERADRGLPALRSNDQLARAALDHSRDMVVRRYFAHQSPSGATVVDRVRPTGYIPRARAWLVGENLAWGTGALAAPAALVRSWLDSPGHRDNMLSSDYREIGIGTAIGAPVTGHSGGATVTTNFGMREEGGAEGSSRRTAARRNGRRCRTVARRTRSSVRKARRCGSRTVRRRGR